eukprot:181820_1
MSLVVEDFSKRAQEAEQKLKSLESQINALVSSSLGTQSMQHEEKESNWEVIYWRLKNRGNFIRLIFAESGVPFKNIDKPHEMKATFRSDLFGAQQYDEGGPYQAMAPPIIRNGSFVLSQSIVCMGYLAERFGICPKSKVDHARAQMMANNAENMLAELYDYKDKTKEELFEYLKDDGRFDIWLSILEKPLKSKNLNYYFEDRCTQADLAVFNVMDGVEELFGEASFQKYVSTKHEYLVKYYNKLKQRESIKQLMDKQEGMFSFSPKLGWSNIRNILRE